MKKIILVILFMLSLGGALGAYEINWVSRPDRIAIGQPMRLVFNVGNTDNDYESVDGQIMHLVLVDQSLEIFDHFAPVLGKDGNFTQDITFPEEVRYLLFFYFKPALELPVTLQASLDVGRSLDRFSTVRMYFDTDRITDDMMKVAFTTNPEDLREKTAAEITFSFIEGDSGKPVKNLQNCLGGGGELVIISAGGRVFLQVPSLERIPADIDQKKAGKILFGPRVTFKVNFPEKGIYKLWGEFRHKKNMIVVPFMVTVK